MIIHGVVLCRIRVEEEEKLEPLAGLQRLPDVIRQWLRWKVIIAVRMVEYRKNQQLFHY